MFGWFRRAARRASSTNIEVNSESCVNSSFSSLTTTSLLKPRGPCDAAKNTTAIPPLPSSAIGRYFPNALVGATAPQGNSFALHSYNRLEGDGDQNHDATDGGPLRRLLASNDRDPERVEDRLDRGKKRRSK